jgi:hypothetical protein
MKTNIDQYKLNIYERTKELVNQINILEYKKNDYMFYMNNHNYKKVIYKGESCYFPEHGIFKYKDWYYNSCMFFLYNLREDYFINPYNKMFKEFINCDKYFNEEVASNECIMQQLNLFYKLIDYIFRHKLLELLDYKYFNIFNIKYKKKYKALKKIEILNNLYKILKENGLLYFYHVTDINNVNSIIKNNGLYSKYMCFDKKIPISHLINQYGDGEIKVPELLKTELRYSGDEDLWLYKPNYYMNNDNYISLSLSDLCVIDNQGLNLKSLYSKKVFTPIRLKISIDILRDQEINLTLKDKTELNKLIIMEYIYELCYAKCCNIYTDYEENTINTFSNVLYKKPDEITLHVLDYIPLKYITNIDNPDEMDEYYIETIAKINDTKNKKSIFDDFDKEYDFDKLLYGREIYENDWRDAFDIDPDEYGGSWGDYAMQHGYD